MSNNNEDVLSYLPPSEIIRLFPEEEYHLPRGEEFFALLDQTRRVSPYFNTNEYHLRASVSQQKFYAVFEKMRARIPHRNQAARGNLSWFLGRKEKDVLLDHPSRSTAVSLEYQLDNILLAQHPNFALPENIPLTLYGIQKDVFSVQAVRTHMPEEKDSAYFWPGGCLSITS